MIEKILPATVASAEAFTDPPDAVLFPQEEALMATAAGKRRREFATARSCARTALAELGVTPAPILRGERGEPRWPPGFVGSITHCAGYRAAAVARAIDVLAIGVDAEPDEPLPDGVLDIVSGPGERERLRRLAAAAPATCWDRLLFSAKESVYKAWFPLTGRWLDYEDVDLSIDAADGTFGARLLTDATRAGGFLLTGFAGRWLASDGLIVTAVTVPSGGARARMNGRGAGSGGAWLIQRPAPASRAAELRITRVSALSDHDIVAVVTYLLAKHPDTFPPMLDDALSAVSPKEAARRPPRARAPQARASASGEVTAPNFSRCAVWGGRGPQSAVRYPRAHSGKPGAAAVVRRLARRRFAETRHINRGSGAAGKWYLLITVTPRSSRGDNRDS